jgi:glycosyltransferase involved in cell wall biosynthesis
MDRIVLVNNEMKQAVSEGFPSGHPPPIVIPNGYGSVDFKGIKIHPPSNRLVIGHVGSIYGSITPRPLFEALSLAMTEKPEMKNQIDVVFIGRMQEEFIVRKARRAGVLDIIQIEGYRPHSETIELMHRCHVLLLFGGNGSAIRDTR